MSDHPILFSGPMVRALLEGRKTQTRRVLKSQPPAGVERVFGPEWYEPEVVDRRGELVPGKPVWGVYDEFGVWGARVPYAPGDRLYVREAHYLTDDGDYERAVIAVETEAVAVHLATIARLESSHPTVDWSRHRRLRPAMHMPRWASRLTLAVTDVRVQRLQQISADDALAEGVIRQDPTPEDEAWNRQWCEGEGIEADPLEPVWLAPGTRQGFGSRPNDPQWGPTPEFAFRLLWDSINASRGFGWEANPWVVAVTFEVQRRNIDHG